MILAIETSQREGGVALARDIDSAGDVERLAPGNRHDDGLVPAIDRLFRRADLTPADLTGVGISAGPGGFTGLRIAVAAGKMLALTQGVRLAAVPSALVAATGTLEDDDAGGPVLVALAAKRETFWGTRVVREHDGWRIDGAPGLVDAASMSVDGISACLADAYFPDTASERCRAAGVPIIEPRFDALACLAVARRMLADGETVEGAQLAPIYPRAPEAVRVWDERHGR